MKRPNHSSFNFQINIIVNEPIPNCISQLGDNLEAFVLDLIGLGFRKRMDIERIVKSSLFGVQNGNVEGILQETVKNLIENKFLKIADDVRYFFVIFIENKYF